MKALLTGITGNLGSEVALDLTRRGIEIIPIVRPSKREFAPPMQFESILENDLLGEGDIEFAGKADCIVHCAGVVHFRDARNTNETMMRKVLNVAGALRIPLYFVSTAFVYRPHGINIGFNNSYENDKYRAEQILVSSKIPCAIFRPSILTGHSHTGKIQNFSGYYLMVRALLSAVRNAAAKNRILRFPRMIGKLDMVPVDQVAGYIGRSVQNGRLETLFVTNPAPPQSEWVLDETLKFYGVRNNLEVIDVSFEEYGELDLTEEEHTLYRFASHFAPYWSMKYNFPQSICTDNLITREYLSTALSYFRDAENLTHEQRKN